MHKKVGTVVPTQIYKNYASLNNQKYQQIKELWQKTKYQISKSVGVSLMLG